MLRPVETPALDDDLPLPALLDAAAAHADYLERSGQPEFFELGPRRIARAEYVAAIRHFVSLGRAARSKAEFLVAVRNDYEFYEAAFANPILVTAYYEPLLDGAREATPRFTQPLYRAPNDPRLRSATRAEIDTGHVLAGRGLELCWVDPLDAFNLQTEGSGVVRFSDGTRLPLAYGGNNGQPHTRLAPFLAAHIPAGRMNFHTMSAYLRSLSERGMRDVLEHNPRYVYFKPRPEGEGPPTSLGVAATDGRTIATDRALVPKGGLAFLVTEKPVFANGRGPLPSSFAPLSRFVLDEDTGSGIRGARVDLFWGSGPDAELHAGAMQRHGRLYYLAPRAH